MTSGPIESPGGNAAPQVGGARRTHRNHDGIILALACVAQFMVILDVSVVNVALPSIGKDLHYSLPLAIFALGNILGTILGGQLADRMADRRLTFACFMICSAAAGSSSLARRSSPSPASSADSPPPRAC